LKCLILLFIPDSGDDFVLSVKDILQSLRENKLVSEAHFKDGEFYVTPRPETGEKPFKFKILLKEECAKGNA